MATPRRALGTLSANNVVVRPSLNKPPAPIAHARAALDAAAQTIKASTTPSIGTLHLAESDGGIHTVELVKEIGEGGFGTVYLASSSRSTAPLACKMVGHGGDPDELADIAREVAVHKLLVQSGSPHLVHLHSHYTEDVRSILLLELCHGMELLELLDEAPNGRLAETEARSLGKSLLEAVAHCHDSGVVHLDVQPRNVIVDQSTHSLKLIDYGASNFVGPHAAAPKRAAGDSDFDIAEALRGFVRDRGGAANYRAPERHAGDDDEDDECTFFDGRAADAYAVGCTLFFMLTGHDAFEWEDAESEQERAALHDAIAGGEIPFDSPGALPSVSGAAQRLIRSLLAYAPEERPSVHEACRDGWIVHGDQAANKAKAKSPSGSVDAMVSKMRRLSVETACVRGRVCV